MACAGCGQARQQFVTAVRRGDLGGATRAVGMAVNINLDKLRGVDVQKKYGASGSRIVEAKPYRRNPDRTT
jgi:hypothetical protein